MAIDPEYARFHRARRDLYGIPLPADLAAAEKAAKKTAAKKVTAKKAAEPDEK